MFMDKYEIGLTYQVCLNDVLYHFELGKVCALLQIQERGHHISDFWYELDR